MQTVLLILSFASGASTLAIATHAAYRLGRQAGLIEGVSLERLRREQVEARIRQQIDAATRADRELWETEIDA